MTSPAFLNDYSELRPAKKLDGAYAYLNPAKSLREFSNIMIDAVEVLYHENAKSQGVEAEKLQSQAGYFLNAAIRAVADAHPVVDTLGPLGRHTHAVRGVAFHSFGRSC